VLVTLEIANSIKIGNHNKDPEVTFISSLELKSMNIKSGLAEDTISVSMPRSVLRGINPLIYLTNGYSVRVSIFTGDEFKTVLDGIILTISSTVSQNITLNIGSKASFYMKQLFLPRIENVCQLQVYSELCGAQEVNNTLACTSIPIDTLTGLIPYSLSDDEIILGGKTISLVGKEKFKTMRNYNLAFIDLGGSFRSKILKVTASHLAIDLNFIDDMLTFDLNIILSCDKTYGGCHAKFGNTKHFYGFANLGKQSKNYNIFTSEALTYCGEPGEPQEECTSDNHIFGVEL